MPGFHVVCAHLLTAWHEDWDRCQNVPLRQAFRRRTHEYPLVRRRPWGGRSKPRFMVSTKDVHGVGITMWMNNQ